MLTVGNGGISARMRREDPCLGLALAAENDVPANGDYHHSAYFTRPGPSVNAEHRRLFRFVLPARIDFCGLAPHCGDASEDLYHRALQVWSR